MFYISSLNIEKSVSEEIADVVKSYVEKKLNQQKSKALTLAILLSQNEALKSTLEDLDEEKGYIILSTTLKTLKRYTNLRGMRAQVIAKDLTIFARSWDKEFTGMPIEGFRKDLSNFKITKPKVSIESGRLLTIKATAPMKRGYKTIGFLEIIGLFEPLTEELRKEGIELFVLMDSSYLDVATLMRENPTLHSYVVANRNYNSTIFKELLAIDMLELQRKGVVKEGDYLFITDQMLNSRGERLGIFLIALDEETMKKFSQFDESLSFFLDYNTKEFSEIINLWEHPQESFRSVYDKSVIEFLSKSEESELKKEFEIEAREILQNYTKEELIDIIINRYKQEKKRGVIR